MGFLLVSCMVVVSFIAHRLYITCVNHKKTDLKKQDDDLEENDLKHIEKQLKEDCEECGKEISENCKYIHSKVIEKLNEIKKQFEQHLISEQLFGSQHLQKPKDEVIENNFVDASEQTDVNNGSIKSNESIDDLLSNDIIVDFVEDDMGTVDVSFVEAKGRLTK